MSGHGAATTALRCAAWLFLVAFVFHTVDHVRRGVDTLTPALFWAGNVSSVISVAVVAVVLWGHSRAPLIALNVWLPEGTLTDARAIAARVRETGGGPPGVRALGLYLPEAGMAQVSMNIEDHRAATPAMVVQAVRTEAERLGIEAGEAELVGLIPRDALLGGPTPAALGIRGFRPGMVIDTHTSQN